MTERDPYRRRFSFPKWNRTVTVCDVPALFRRLPEFADWSKAKHEQVAREYHAVSVSTADTHAAMLHRMETLYGTNGSLISSGFREDWPDAAKDACRTFAHLTTEYRDKSLAHWRAAGRSADTWRRL